MKQDIELLQSHPLILGIDEAGRGPWAGPVVIAGVVITANTKIIPEVNDSKKLSEKRRAELFPKIIEECEYKIVSIDSQTIDKIGIGVAVINGMNEIIEHFKRPYTLIDGYFKEGSFPKSARCIIKGDALCYSIGAASILAKYTRDQTMIEYDQIYPQYNFKAHKGYGTKEHEETLMKYGISPIHRISYKPIANLHSNRLPE